jgi:hypothetical protein
MRLLALSGGVKFQLQKKSSCLKQRPQKMTISKQSSERRMCATKQSLKRFGPLGCVGQSYVHFSPKTSTSLQDLSLCVLQKQANHESFLYHHQPSEPFGHIFMDERQTVSLELLQTECAFYCNA